MRRVAAVFAGPVMTLAGINHFVMPQAYASIVPDWLPAPMGLVYISGLGEIVGGLGTMHPRTRRAAGWLLIVALVAVFPGNIYIEQRRGLSGRPRGAVEPHRASSLPGTLHLLGLAGDAERERRAFKATAATHPLRA